MEMPIKRWLDINELHGYLGISESKIYKMVMKHEIPYRKIGGRLLFGSREIDEWMLKGLVKPIRKDNTYSPPKILDNVTL